MRLFLKILGGIGGLLLLLVIAAAIAVSTVDVNTFVAPIQQRVKDATGRDLAIRGGISLSLSLQPRLVLNDVSLGNATWGKAPQLLKAKRIEAQMQLLPLLLRRFEIDQFILVEPTIALETDNDGTGNWEFNASAAGSVPATPTPDGALSALSVDDLAINNGVLSYRDGKTGNVTDVVIDSLSLHARDAQSPISAQFRGKVADVAVAVEGDLGPLDTLLQRRWPYPITMSGQINSQKTTLSTKLRAEGATVTFDEMQIATGSTKATGTLAVTREGTRPKYSLTFAATTLALADLPLARPVASTARTAAAASGTSHGSDLAYDAPIDFSVLQASDIDVALTAAALVLADGRRIDNVRVQLSIRNARLDAPVVEASVFGGKAQGRLTVDATHDKDPAVTVHLDANALDLGALLAAFGEKRDVRGGKTNVTIDVVAHGVSPRQWVSDMTGTVTAIVGPATLGNSAVGRTAALDRLGEAVNPFRKTDPSTDLTCAVIRLPLKDGVAQVDHSIAMETKKVGASASGTLNFRTETLDLSFKPQIREGIRIEIPQVAQLVRFRGPFASPSVTIDATATAATVARIGAAISTGGLSVLGETLFSTVTAGAGGPCQQALAPGAPSSQATTSTSAATKPANPVTNALDKLLRR